MSKKVYISGPITGTTDYMERFAAVEQKLVAEGYEVINPAKLNEHFPADTSWETYMRESLKMLCECDAIYMLADWFRSRGATLEFNVAQGLRLEVMCDAV